MKICFIDWFAYGLFDPKSKIVFGGAQIQLYFLSKELAKDKKYTVSFLTDNQKNNQIQTFSNVKVYQFVRSPKTPGVFGRLFNLLYRILALGNTHFFLRLLMQLGKINSEIYVQRAASAETGLIALICKVLHKQFIFMVAHDQDVNGDFVRQNGWRGKLFLLGLRLANKIVCQMREQQRQLPKNLRSKSVILAPAFPILPRSGLKKVKKQGILWVARAETWKNPELFLDLAAQFPKEKFIMICPPAENNPSYFTLIKKKAKQIPNLQFIPWVPFNQINAFFRKSKIFVSTSLVEGFPNTFIQASKNMTPIISYKVNPDKIISQNKFGFCAQGDKNKLAIYLKKILNDQKLWHKLSTRAYQYVAKHHALKNEVTQFKRVIKSTSSVKGRYDKI